MLRHAHLPDDAGGSEPGDAASVRIVGVVDPDGMGGDIGAIAARAAELVDEGADLVDVDTVAGVPRPVDVRWVARLVRRIVAEGASVGVTTTSADVVVAVVDAGAQVVVDPSGGTSDRFMPPIVAAANVSFVLGQSIAAARIFRPTSPWEFRALAARRVEALVELGLPVERIVLDSGVGWFSHGESEWGVLDHLEKLGRVGRPLFVDASREALFGPGTGPLDAAGASDEEDAAALGVGVVAAAAHAWGIRVSNVVRTAAVLGGARSSRTRHGVGILGR